MASTVLRALGTDTSSHFRLFKTVDSDESSDDSPRLGLGRRETSFSFPATPRVLSRAPKLSPVMPALEHPNPLPHSSDPDVDFDTLINKPPSLNDDRKVGGDWRCNMCNKVFKKKRYLQQHRAGVHGVKCHACEVCGSLFTTKHRVSSHKNAVHGMMRRNTTCSSSPSPARSTGSSPPRSDKENADVPIRLKMRLNRKRHSRKQSVPVPSPTPSIKFRIQKSTTVPFVIEAPSINDMRAIKRKRKIAEERNRVQTRDVGSSEEIRRLLDQATEMTKNKRTRKKKVDLFDYTEKQRVAMSEFCSIYNWEIHKVPRIQLCHICFTIGVTEDQLLKFCKNQHKEFKAALFQSKRLYNVRPKYSTGELQRAKSRRTKTCATSAIPSKAASREATRV